MNGDRPNAVSARTAAVAPSATLAISAIAARLRAAGEPVIGYGAGEPDFPTPAHIVEAARAAVSDPVNHHYSTAAGLEELRDAVVVKTKRDSRYEIGVDQVVVTNGGKHAIYAACQVLLDPGDEVLLPSPYWVSYPEIIGLADAVPVIVPAGVDAGFEVTVDQLERARTARTKMLVFVSPSNPTGAVYSPDAIRAIGEWATEHGIWVLTDEIYELLVYGDTEFVSMPAQVPELAERCVVVNGVAKTYAMTGWRVGWLAAPPEIASAAARLQSHMTSNVSNVSQRAAIAAIIGPQEPVREMRDNFDRRRRIMFEMLSGIDGIRCSEPMGALYTFPSVEGLLGRTFAGRSPATSLDLAQILLEEINVAVVPGEAFGAPGYLRFSFALGDDDLVEGLERIAAFVG